MNLERRHFIRMAPAAGLAVMAGSCATHPGAHSSVSAPGNLYRVDDDARILAVAREIIAEDWVATLITVDEEGVPRARSVGVNDPLPDLTIWMSTRRDSRKVDQIRRHPQATLHFARDNLRENFRGAYYASLMGEAFVHVDPESYAGHAPSGEIRTENWPDFPHDYAAIRFKPRWLEVYGRGIKGKPETWQPQAVVLPA
ncbi:MAG TPA: pyridoxamine 5'-phosphate oxidase family protein [Xanthomonadaceae bacterium]|nr:pyridoxamine 5'-phosphate oxidase family protein [Xanthomonadaceae bacterium]